MRVFLDANVLFSAAYLASGSPAALFSLARAGACEIVSSRYAVEEARRNILVKRPARGGELDRLARSLALAAEPSPDLVAWATQLGLPMKDAPILAAAAGSGCHLLVTGDVTHFGALYGTRQRGTVVLRPVEAIELLL